MRALMVIGVLWAAATPADAQFNAPVYNAAAYTGAVLLSNPWAYYPSPLFYGASLNTVSPGMRAVLLTGNPTTVSGAHSAALSIRPVGSATQITASVISAVGNIVTFVVPAEVPAGAAQLSYVIDSGPNQWTSLTVVQGSFAFFVNPSAGQAIAQAVSTSGALSPIGLATPALPGQLVQFTGSGLGNGSPVSITAGGVPAILSFAGPDPSQAGVDQILFQVPLGLSYGCYVPVTVTYNQASITTSMSVTADGSPCRHPFGLSVGDEQILDGGGSIFTGQVGVTSGFSAATADAVYRDETAAVRVGNWNASALSTFAQPRSPGCSVISPGFSVTLLGNIFTVPALPDLGATLTLLSSAKTLTLLSSSGDYASFENAGTFVNPPVPVIAGGKWTWQSSGSADLPAASFSFSVPEPIQVSGSAPLSLRRDQDQTVAWNGANFDAAATVSASLTGHGADGTSIFMTCSATANSGSFTIPSALLGQFGSHSMGTLYLGVTESPAGWPSARFTLNSGQTLLMLAPYTGSDTRPVDFQ